MKFFPALFTFFADTNSRRNVRLLVRFFVVLVILITVFSVIFHGLMVREGQAHSWATGVYWVLTVMSTLGFGDITFYSDAGRIFSIVVLLSGMIFLLILMPFTLIEFFYAPWIESQRRALAARHVPEEVHGHVILANIGPVIRTLIRHLKSYNVPYYVLVDEVDEAMDLRDEGIATLVGEADNPQTYGRLRLEVAALIVATDTDTRNTNIAFTVRAMSESLPIVTSASNADSVDILELAGSSEVLRLDSMMGRALARHVIGGDAQAHLLGTFDEVRIAEATVRGTPMVGKSIAGLGLRESVGITIVGVWSRGLFTHAEPGTVIAADTILLIAGSKEQLEAYNQLFCIYHVSEAPVVIIGGGRVGRAASSYLRERGIEHRIIEKEEARVHDSGLYIHGSAADRETLERAGFGETPTVIVTTHDDDLNIYLTIYCRRLREDVQIISRSVLTRNVPTLHRAGADFVLSYASMGANAIFNVLKRGQVLMIAEGLNVFRAPVPEALHGCTMASAAIRERSGCHVVGLKRRDAVEIGPPADASLRDVTELILVASPEQQSKFLSIRWGRRG